MNSEERKVEEGEGSGLTRGTCNYKVGAKGFPSKVRRVPVSPGRSRVETAGGDQNKDRGTKDTSTVVCPMNP